MLPSQILSPTQLVHQSAMLKMWRRATRRRHPWTFFHAGLIAHNPAIRRLVSRLLSFGLGLRACLWLIRVISHFPRIVCINARFAGLHSVVQLLGRQAAVLGPQLSFFFLLNILVVLYEIEQQFLVELSIDLRIRPVVHEIWGAPNAFSLTSRQST